MGIIVHIGIDDSGKSNEELEFCDVLDSVKQDHSRWLGVASGGKGGLFVLLCEWQGKGWFYSMIIDWFYYKRKLKKERVN